MMAAGKPPAPLREASDAYKPRDGPNVQWQGALRGADTEQMARMDSMDGRPVTITSLSEPLTSPGRMSSYGRREMRSTLPTYEY